MTVRPPAGTRRRGKTAAEDTALERELLADPKERAEHVMLIGLGRNDVGRVASTGTVKLLRNMEIERYSRAMHIVTEVTGRIPPITPPLEVLRAAFPAGTQTRANARSVAECADLTTARTNMLSAALESTEL